ncbi:hypothetical protein A2U01_0036979, partial [Trifolium medium]|nr:hypothetical protein [Trifolium medium]
TLQDTTSKPVAEQPKSKLVPISSKKTKDKSELSTGASTSRTIAREKQPLEPGKQDKAKKKRKSKQDEAESKGEALDDEASEGKETSRTPIEEQSAEKQKKKKKKKDKTLKGKSSSSQSKLEAASTPSAETMPQQLNVGTDPPRKDGPMPTIVEETSPDATVKQ